MAENDPAPDGPPETSDVRRGQVLRYLLRAAGGWVDGTDLATEEVGGSEGLRRLRELRTPEHGEWLIYKKKKRGTTYYMYRVAHLPDCPIDHPEDTDCEWRPL